MSRLSHRWERLLAPFGRRLAAVQRNLPRPARRDILRFTPVTGATTGPRLAVLCEPRTRWDALWAMWSFLRFLGPQVRPALFVDGPLDLAWEKQASRLFPDVQIHSVPMWLSTRDNPLNRFPAFAAHYPFARKLALLLCLQQEGDVVYADADVLCFADPVAVHEALEQRAFRYLADLQSSAVDPAIARRAAKLGWQDDPHFNSGLLTLPRDSCDESIYRPLLAGWCEAEANRFTEQTVLSVIGCRHGAKSFSPAEYVVSSHGMFFWHRDISYDGVIARHFVGTVRHLMYATGYRLLRHQAETTR